MENLIITIIDKYLLLGVFGLLLSCGIGLPMPEDVILITAGYLSYTYPQNVSLPVLVLVCMAGVLIGDTIIFMVGKRLGPRVMKLPLFKRILTEARLEKMNGYFNSYGNKIIFAGRFMAGIRAPLFLTAGVTGHPYRKFILFDGLAAMISVPTIVLLSHHFGEEIDQVKYMLIKIKEGLLIIIPLAIIIWFLYKRFAWKKESEIVDSKKPEDGAAEPVNPKCDETKK
ncbi:MAG: DedA family protein [Candidatus Omnitrophota bacterium]